MNETRRRTLAALLLVGASGACAQTCRNDIPATAPDERFTANGDGTVSDAATGLRWKRCSEGQAWDGATCTGSATMHTWQAALQLADSASDAGSSDWRLPNKNELESLVELRCSSPAINATFFPATPLDRPWFWSASPSGYGDNTSTHAWFVYFDSGYVGWDYWVDKSKALHVRLVRAGQ